MASDEKVEHRDWLVASSKIDNSADQDWLVFKHVHDKALLPRSFEIDFQLVIGGLSASTPRMWCASLFANH